MQTTSAAAHLRVVVARTARRLRQEAGSDLSPSQTSALAVIERPSDPADRRSSLVSITPEGRELLRRLRTRKDAFLARRLEGLTADELATLERAADILERVLAE